MEVGQQVGHLLVRKATVKGRHVAFAGENDATDLGIGGRNAAGERASVEEAMEVGRDFLEGQVVVAVAVGAAHFVEMLPFRLLRSEFSFGAAAGWSHNQAQRRNCAEDGFDERCERRFVVSGWNGSSSEDA